ncbi:hypothetical protein [Bdellovibrio bacteriovorus]|uniref:hypothetical protein n=1 Tax=Bdellovibrio TaxID=958 RepID=UPI0035A9A9D7
MKKDFLKKKIQGFKSNKKQKKETVTYEETYYEEINSRSFDYNFNVLIHHYKKTEGSLSIKPK